MKYIITESQLDNIIFNYLDSKKFFALKVDGDIYLYPSERDWREHLSYAIIAFHSKNDDCYISCELVTEVSTFFSMSLVSSLSIISKWVEESHEIEIGSPYSDCGAD